MANGRKTGGRKTGSINKTSFAIKQGIKNLVTDYLDEENGQVWADLDEVDAATRLNVMVKFSAFVTPKEKDITIKPETRVLGGKRGEIDSMTADQLRAAYPEFFIIPTEDKVLPVSKIDPPIIP